MTNKTYQELDNLRKSMLKMAIDEGKFRDLELIANTLGKRTVTRGHDVDMVFEIGNITLTVLTVGDVYSIKYHDFLVKTCIRVWVDTDTDDPKTVVYYWKANLYDLPDNQDHPPYRYIPGKWERGLFAELPKVKSILGAAEHEAAEEKRQQMERLLLIGKDI